MSKMKNLYCSTFAKKLFLPFTLAAQRPASIIVYNIIY